jgi:anti-sigma factor RsiW
MTEVHDEVQTLLPWFVNGTLNEREQSTVSAHLETCTQCWEDFQEVQQIVRRFHTPALVPPLQVSAWAGDFVAGLPRDARPTISRSRAMTVASACIVFVVAIGLLPPSVSYYRTLSTPAVVLDGRIIQVVFRPDATEQVIREILLDDGNEVLSGPTRQGVYRIRLGQGQLSGVYVARLRQRPEVIFVEAEANP